MCQRTTLLVDKTRETFNIDDVIISRAASQLKSSRKPSPDEISFISLKRHIIEISDSHSMFNMRFNLTLSLLCAMSKLYELYFMLSVPLQIIL